MGRGDCPAELLGTPHRQPGAVEVSVVGGGGPTCIFSKTVILIE